MNTLRTRLAGIELEHPVLNASGILGSEPEHIEILARAGFSGIVTKTITLEPREGYPPPIIIRLDNEGFLNAVGLANPGVNAICPLAERARALGKPIILSIGGRNPEEFTRIAIKAEECHVDAIELNLSCPHVKEYGAELGSDPDLVYRVTRDVVSVVKVPVFAKLGLSDRVTKSAEKALEAGAAGLTLINTIRAIAIDVYTGKPILSNKYGGLSGPPVKPIALRVVYDVYRELRAEIIGCGGIRTWRDVAEFILAGARAVQVGSWFMVNRSIVYEILSGLKSWMELQGFKSINDAIGLAHKA